MILNTHRWNTSTRSWTRTFAVRSSWRCSRRRTSARSRGTSQQTLLCEIEVSESLAPRSMEACQLHLSSRPCLLADPKRGGRDARPSRSIFFHFRAVCGENLPKIIAWRPTFRVGAPPLENPFNVADQNCTAKFRMPQEIIEGKIRPIDVTLP